MVKKKNRNIVLLKSIEDLKNEISYKEFLNEKNFKNNFKILCQLIPNRQDEKLGFFFVEFINKRVY